MSPFKPPVPAPDRSGVTAACARLSARAALATAAAVVTALLAVSVPAFAADVPPTPTPTPTSTSTPTVTVTGVPKPPLAPPTLDPAPTPGAVIVPLAPLPPTPEFPAWIDDFARYEPQFQCLTTAQPGTAALQALLSATYGLTEFSTVRPCNGSISEHHDGRALDVMLKASDPGQRATADAILGWLLGPDTWGNPSAVARRLGVMYVIFDHYIWRAYRPEAGWLPYSGTESHDDHIHISLSPAGAQEQTSWWSLDPMTVPGVHLLGTRWWRVSCAATVEPGARCVADIKATQIVWNTEQKRFAPVLTWVRNRTTTVATESATWDVAPTGHTGDSVTARGAALHTTCSAEAPTPRVCKTSELADVIVRMPAQGTVRASYATQQRWVLRSVVKIVAPLAAAAPVPVPPTAAATPAPLRRR